MSATLVSSNTTIKMNTAVAAAGTSTGAGAVTVYTAPAGTFSIVNVFVTHAASGSLTVGGQGIAAVSGSSNFNLQGVYIGPSQSLVINSGTLGLNNTASVSGVNFTNTP
jgi:hypothetical protein